MSGFPAASPKMAAPARWAVRGTMAFGMAMVVFNLGFGRLGAIVGHSPPQRQLLQPLPPRNLTQAALAILLDGCGPDSVASAEGVPCRADVGVPTVLSFPEDSRWDPTMLNPCTPRPSATGESFCVPHFYVLGVFHSGSRDLFSRLALHPQVIQPSPSAHGARSYAGEYWSETHSWERQLWRGCDWGGCPQRRGAAVEPLPREDMAQAASRAGKGPLERVVFGEAIGTGLTTTWSSTHSLLHRPWAHNLSGCLPGAREVPAKEACFVQARAAQVAWEDSLAPVEEGGINVPWLMRSVHGLRLRFVVLLREQSARLASAFWFWPQYRRRYGATAAGLHRFTAEMAAAFDQCLRSVGAVYAHALRSGGREAARAASRRGYTSQQVGLLPPAAEGYPEEDVLLACAHQFESLSLENERTYYHADQHIKSLYQAFVPQLVATFGRDAVHIDRTEDYVRDPEGVLRTVHKHLGLATLREAQWEAVLREPVARLRGSDNATYWADKAVINRVSTHTGGPPTRVQVPMLPKTAALLQQWFAPYNARLAWYLGDERFTWTDVLGRTLP